MADIDFYQCDWQNDVRVTHLPIKLPRHKYLGTGAQLVNRLENQNDENSFGNETKLIVSLFPLLITQIYQLNRCP